MYVKADSLKRQLGVTMVELLISLVVGSLVVTAAYASYAVVQSIQSGSGEQSEINQSGREVVRMLSRDLRMAGFVHPDNLSFSAVSRSIPSAVSVVNDQPLICSGTTYSNDQITVVFDRAADSRERISYRVACELDRVQLQQRIEQSSGGGYSTLQGYSPIVDDVANLQFLFIDGEGNSSSNVPTGMERIELSFDVLSLSRQQGRSSSPRLLISYRATVTTCNLGCG